MSDEIDDIIITINLRSCRNVSMSINILDLINGDNSGDASVGLRRHFNFVIPWAILNSDENVIYSFCNESSQLISFII